MPFEDPLSRLPPERRELLRKVIEQQNLLAKPMAIVGMACRFPGGADSPEAFWSLLRSGRDAVDLIPDDRWNPDLYAAPPTPPGKTNSRWGGFLKDVGGLDAEFFGMSPREVEVTDPQQRQLLEVGYEALESAGVPYRGRPVGVYVGLAAHDFFAFEIPSLLKNPYGGVGLAHSLLSGRLAYQFDLRGPTAVISSACTSSFAAVHLACSALERDEAELALVCGVNLILSSRYSILSTSSGTQSPTGRCRSFDAAADGFVRSEAVAAIVLKPLARALLDGDRVHAVIRGSAMVHGGRGNGISAPRKQAQVDAIRKAFARAAAVPGDAHFFEGMGAGSPLGDAIEIGAIAGALDADGERTDTRLLGSVKSNIGHTEGAAGLASIIKVALALSNRRIPPNLHFEKENAMASLAEARLHVVTELREWPAAEGEPLIAGVHGTGFNGSNAHIVMSDPSSASSASSTEAAPPWSESDALAAEGLEWVFPASAKTAASLEQWCERFHTDRSLGGEQGDYDTLYTAACRRTHHRVRRAAIGRTKSEWSTDLVRARASVGALSSIGSIVIGDGGSEAMDPTWEKDPAFLAHKRNCSKLLSESSSPGTARFVERWALACWLVSVVPEGVAVLGEGRGAWVAECMNGRLSPSDALSRWSQSSGAPASGPGAPPAGSEGRLTVLFDSGQAATATSSNLHVSIASRRSFLSFVQEIFERGIDVRWESLLPTRGRVVTLPSYCWEHTTYWPEDFIPERAGSSAPKEDSTTSSHEWPPLDFLLDLEEDEQLRSLRTLTAAAIATTLRRKVSDVEHSESLLAIGLDSVVSSQLRNQLQQWLGLARLDVSEVTSLTTLSALTAWIHERALERLASLLDDE